jgi:hypothetical protein
MAKPKPKPRPIAADNPHTAQLNVTVRPDTLTGLDARAVEEAERTGYAVTRTDLVRRVLAIVARDPEALRALLERA